MKPTKHSSRNPGFTFDGTTCLLACPECRCSYTHVEKAYALDGSDPFEGRSEFAGELYGVPVGGTTEERRGCLVIQIWCENDHTFEIRLQQRRGETEVEVRR